VNAISDLLNTGIITNISRSTWYRIQSAVILYMRLRTLPSYRSYFGSSLAPSNAFALPPVTFIAIPGDRTEYFSYLRLIKMVTVFRPLLS